MSKVDKALLSRAAAGARVGPWGPQTGGEVNIPKSDTEKQQQVGVLGEEKGPWHLQGR